MRVVILIILTIVNLFSIIQLGQYGSGDLIAMMSLRVILSVITFLLSLAYILVRGTKSEMIMSTVTGLIALSHFGYIVYINL
ncbi:hypothetical protein [Salinicoccus albus]|uniref:hypothetical protein n=1 Tax=Salinicoccus albus TaxID=418756 RepID=UPI0003640567|nr:hypothetical protein [Salinicoccus albus]